MDIHKPPPAYWRLGEQTLDLLGDPGDDRIVEDEGQGRQQQRQGLLFAFFLVGHGGASFPAVTYYIIGSPGFASPLLCIIAKNDERFL